MRFHDERQPAALAALAAGDEPLAPRLADPPGRASGRLRGADLGFSVEAGGREACVDELYLLPEVRGRGLGGRALALVEDRAQALGVRRIFLEVERRNRVLALYRRAGYVDHDRFLLSKFLDR